MRLGSKNDDSNEGSNSATDPAGWIEQGRECVWDPSQISLRKHGWNQPQIVVNGFAGWTASRSRRCAQSFVGCRGSRGVQVSVVNLLFSTNVTASIVDLIVKHICGCRAFVVASCCLFSPYYYRHDKCITRFYR